MPSIRIHHGHSLPAEQAHAAVCRIAEKIAEQFSVSTRWHDNVLHFTRSGVNGHIVVDSDSVQVNADLSFFLSPLKPKVESEIRRYLDEQLV